MRLFFLLIFNLPLLVFSQQLSRSEEFTIRTPFVESDGRIVTVKDKNNQIYMIGKSKGGNSQSSEYVIQKYSPDLDVLWSTTKSMKSNEQLLGIQILDEIPVLFWTQHRMKKRERVLHMEKLSPNDGFPTAEMELIVEQLDDWREVVNKGQSVKGLQNVINSGNRDDLVTPLEYQFHLRTSSDGSKLMAYAYDYSKQDLFINIKIFNADLTPFREAKVPVNRGFIHQTNLVNNQGEVFMVSTKANGLIAVVKYNIESRESNYLEIEASNTDRGSFTALMRDEQKVYVADLNIQSNRMVGISYAEFDFEEDKVGEIVYHSLDRGFKDEIVNMRKFLGAEKDYEHWHFYRIANFQILEDGSKLVMVEQQDYESRGYLYNPEAGNTLLDWGLERSGELRVGDAFVFRFDPEGNLKWYEPIFKHQTGNAHEGFNIIGFKSHVDNNQDIHLVYELYGKAHHAIHYKKIAFTNGKLVTDKVLENPEKMNILMPFTTWMEDRLILVGKKGFSGRTSKILLYKY